MSLLTELDATELSVRIAAREFSCVELMTACLDRIDALNPALNAIVALRPREALLAEARQADMCRSRGWLHGIPVAIKDLADTAGLVTSYGSPVYRRHVPQDDSPMVRRIRTAGAIIIGKTNTPEFGLGSHTYNPVYGITSNPYKLSLSAGGSSGGAAAALAARLVPLADGSDMMGSLRNPAAFNNVYGFRPSAGRIPDDQPLDACQFPLATSGPMGRSIVDIASLLDTMAEADTRQPWRLATGVSFADALRQRSGQSLAGKRIGWIGDAAGHYPMDPGLLALCRSALHEFERLGCAVTPVDLSFDLQALFDAWCTLRSLSIAASLRHLFEERSTRSLLKPEACWEIERGLQFTAMQVHEASALRSRWFARSADLLSGLDALCLPSAAVYPFDASQSWPKSIAGVAMSTYHEWMSVVVPASMAGLPTLAIPAGFNDTGLPAGVQLIGRYGDDSGVLALGDAYHQVTNWPGRRPPTLATVV